jgi:molecular chaperone GrpE
MNLESPGTAPAEKEVKKKEIKLALEEQWAKETVQEEETISEVEEDPAELRQKAEERDEYLDHLQRLKAEFDNYRKRVEREKAEWAVVALEGFITELLDVVDSLKRAQAAVEEANTIESYKRGVDMVFEGLLEILRRQGLEEIPTVGEPFDPYMHEAILQDVRADVPPNTVVEEIAPGYRLKNRVLRAPRVKVSVSPPEGETVKN